MKRFINILVQLLLLVGLGSTATGQILPPQYLTEWHPGGWPLGIDVDNHGRIWVSDYSVGSVNCFTNTGVIVSEFATPWVNPYGVAANDFVYVGSDRYGVSTNKDCVPPSGDFCIFLDSPTDCHGVALDSDENVYIASTGGWTYKYSPDGVQLAAYHTAGQDVGVDHNGNIFIMYDGFVHKLTPDGTEVLQWNGDGTAGGRLFRPEGMGLDQWGNVYVADTGNNRIVVYDGNGTYLTHWGSLGAGPGQFRQVEDVAIDSDGFIYVTDAFNGRIQKFGSLPTPARATSWGLIKSMYR